MQPFSLDAQPESFWNALARRLRPVFGDVTETLGFGWEEWIKHHFNDQDFMVVEEAKRVGAGPRNWFILEWHEGSMGVTPGDDWVQAAASKEECVAHVLERLTAMAVWPTRLEHDDASDCTNFWLNDKLFAAVHPLQPAASQALPAGQVDRLFAGLRQSGDVQAEFAERLADEPGLSGVRVVAELHQPRAVPLHLPCLTEWLALAEDLLERAQFRPNVAAAQAVVAAIFNVPDWQSLCDLMGASAGSDEWVSVGSPFCVSTGHPSDFGKLHVFERLSEATNAFVSVVEHYESLFGNSQAYASLIDDGFWRAGSVVPDEGGDTYPILASVTLEPVRRVRTSAVWEARVSAACAAGYLAGLHSLFMMEATNEQRVKFSAAETGRLVVAIDGPWTILLDDEVAERKSRLWLVLARPDGTLGSAFNAELDSLAVREFMGDLVMTQSSGGQVPVAVLKGLSTSSTRKLCGLCEGAIAAPELEPDELLSNQDLYRLCQSAGEGGAVAQSIH